MTNLFPTGVDCPVCRAEFPHVSDGVCFTCQFWAEQFAAPDGLIINGWHHRIGDEPTAADLADHAYLYGHYGDRFRIRLADGTEIVTHNLWDQGPIPPGLTRPDNAAFVTESRAACDSVQLCLPDTVDNTEASDMTITNDDSQPVVNDESPLRPTLVVFDEVQELHNIAVADTLAQRRTAIWRTITDAVAAGCPIPSSIYLAKSGELTTVTVSTQAEVSAWALHLGIPTVTTRIYQVSSGGWQLDVEAIHDCGRFIVQWLDSVPAGPADEDRFPVAVCGGCKQPMTAHRPSMHFNSDDATRAYYCPACGWWAYLAVTDPAECDRIAASWFNGNPYLYSSDGEDITSEATR